MPVTQGRRRRGRLAQLQGGHWLAVALAGLLLLPLLILGLPALSHATARATQASPTGEPVVAGQEHTVDNVVTVPKVPGQLDLVSVLDLTGSYDKTLPNVRRILPKVAKQLAAKSDLRVGLGSFADDPCCGGASDDFPYRLDLALTDQRGKLATKLDDLRGSSGGDDAESWLTAVDRAGSEAGFRPAASHVILLSTDTNSHYRGDGSGSQGPTVDEVAADLRAANIRLVALLPGDHTATQAVELATATGGSVQRVSRSSDDLDRAIIAGLKGVAVDLAPALSGDCPVSEASFTPARIDGLAAGMRVPFRITFRVAPGARPGRHDCTMDFGQGGKVRLPLVVR